MASSKDLMVIANDSVFQNRVHYYLKQVSISVLSESSAIVGHNARIVFAQRILSGQIAIQDYAIGVVTSSNIALEAVLATTDFSIPDVDIQATVVTLFNAYATVIS